MRRYRVGASVWKKKSGSKEVEENGMSYEPLLDQGSIDGSSGLFGGYGAISNKSLLTGAGAGNAGGL